MGFFRRYIGVAVILGNLLCAIPASAQDLGYEEWIRQLRATAQVMRDWRRTHATMPVLQPDEDECLHKIFNAVSFTPANTTIPILGRGIFRYYYQFQIGMNPSINTIEVINGQYSLPGWWPQALPGTISVLTDGQDTFAAWVTGQDERPIPDPTTNTPLIIRETITPPPPPSTTPAAPTD